MLEKSLHAFAHPKVTQYLWLYIVSIFSLTLGYCFTTKTRYDEVVAHMVFLMQKTSKAISQKKSVQDFLEKHKSGNETLLQEKCNLLQPLSEEISLLSLMLNHPLCLDKDKIQHRLHFLQSEQNKLHFVITDTQKNQKQKQTNMKLASKVFVNQTDLKKILSFIEEETIDEISFPEARPQMIISSFKLAPKKSPFQTENFELYLELLQREFNP